jgi:hypothetical protein
MLMIQLTSLMDKGKQQYAALQRYRCFITWKKKRKRVETSYMESWDPTLPNI